MLQQGDDGDFQNQESKPHPNAVPGPSPKWQVCVWVYGLLVLLTEPRWWLGKRNEGSKTAKPTSYLPRDLSGALQSLVWVFLEVSQATPEMEYYNQALAQDRVGSLLQVWFEFCPSRLVIGSKVKIQAASLPTVTDISCLRYLEREEPEVVLVRSSLWLHFLWEWEVDISYKKKQLGKVILENKEGKQFWKDRVWHI